MVDIDRLSVVELKAQLKKNGLSVAGRKAELVERLRAALDDPEEEEEEEEEEEKAEASTKKRKGASKSKGPAPKKKKTETVEKESENKDDADDETKEEIKEEAKTTVRRGRSANKKEGEKPAPKNKKATNAKKPTGKGKEPADEESKEVAEKEPEDEESKEVVKKQPEVNKEEEDAGASSSAISSDGLPEGWKWADKTLLWWESPDVKHSSKLACFDYDGCLAKTSLFKKGPDAWSILFPEIPEVLKKLNDNGYKLVIFTNQSDIGKSASDASRAKMIAEKTGRLGGFVKKIGLPFQVFIATAAAKVTGDKYRKPATGLWTSLLEKNNGGEKPDMNKSFFVGDAAGRKKDHGDSDKKFAAAVKLKFYTEDEFFKNSNIDF